MKILLNLLAYAVTGLTLGAIGKTTADPEFWIVMFCLLTVELTAKTAPWEQ